MWWCFNSLKILARQYSLFVSCLNCITAFFCYLACWPKGEWVHVECRDCVRQCWSVEGGATNCLFTCSFLALVSSLYLYGPICLRAIQTLSPNAVLSYYSVAPLTSYWCAVIPSSVLPAARWPSSDDCKVIMIHSDSNSIYDKAGAGISHLLGQTATYTHWSTQKNCRHGNMTFSRPCNFCFQNVIDKIDLVLKCLKHVLWKYYGQLLWKVKWWLFTGFSLKTRKAGTLSLHNCALTNSRIVSLVYVQDS